MLTNSTRGVFLLFRDSHQQTACAGLQELEPVQALQAGAQTRRLRQCECHSDSDYSSTLVSFRSHLSRSMLTDSGSVFILCPHLSRLKAAPFGSKSIRIWESLCSTQPLATMSNVLTASTYRRCLYSSSKLLTLSDRVKSFEELDVFHQDRHAVCSLFDVPSGRL